MLEAVERLPGSKYRCKCDCGNYRIVHVGHFNAGYFKSCGCHVERHGHAGKDTSKTYISYHNMIARCHRKSNKRYKDYGGKGIYVCDRWRESFSNFLFDMGECPGGKQIDRIDNTKGYYPENCRWATRRENQRNRGECYRWFVNGVEYPSAQQAAEHLSVSQPTIGAWCKGRTTDGRYYPPKKNCYRIKRYQ